jgi:pSer/pThr/pTyr-binding forkhead associated (FHA) protein
MAKLILMFNKEIIEEFPLVKESVKIGRKPANDIAVDNLAVSGYHARIDKTGDVFILTDLQSTNGTFVNDSKTVTHKLKHGDTITIGKHALLFMDTERPEGADEKDANNSSSDRTMMLDTARQRELLAKQEIPTQQASNSEKIGVLSFLDGSPLGEVELTKKLTRIGKNENAEVKLPGFFIGATAATISRRPSGYTISFSGGFAKLRINGEVVKHTVTLRDYDTIELGSHKFQFYVKERKIA